MKIDWDAYHAAYMEMLDEGQAFYADSLSYFLHKYMDHVTKKENQITEIVKELTNE